jgi:toxin ParE1/3/4
MPEIRISEAARRDLENIVGYTSERNPKAAEKIVREIVGKLRMLRDFPHSGRERPELMVELRSLVVRNYVIFYQSSETKIDVFRILHGAQDIPSAFNELFDAL